MLSADSHGETLRRFARSRNTPTEDSPTRFAGTASEPQIAADALACRHRSAQSRNFAPRLGARRGDGWCAPLARTATLRHVRLLTAVRPVGST